MRSSGEAIGAPMTRWVGMRRAIGGNSASNGSARSGRSAANRPNASLNGTYGKPASPKSMQWPISVIRPPASAREVTSASSLVLPTPASPDSTTEPASRSVAPSSRCCRFRSSTPRPISGLVGRGTGAILTVGTDKRRSCGSDSPRIRCRTDRRRRRRHRAEPTITRLLDRGAGASGGDRLRRYGCAAGGRPCARSPRQSARGGMPIPPRTPWMGEAASCPPESRRPLPTH